MQYSENFKQRVLIALGDTNEMRKRLDEGQEIVGRYLEDASRGGFTAKEIIDAVESYNLEQIYLRAKRQQAIKKLYGEWVEMYQQQNNSAIRR